MNRGTRKWKSINNIEKEKIDFPVDWSICKFQVHLPFKYFRYQTNCESQFVTMNLVLMFCELVSLTEIKFQMNILHLGVLSAQ